MRQFRLRVYYGHVYNGQNPSHRIVTWGKTHLISFLWGRIYQKDFPTRYHTHQRIYISNYLCLDDQISSFLWVVLNSRSPFREQLRFCFDLPVFSMTGLGEPPIDELIRRVASWLAYEQHRIGKKKSPVTLDGLVSLFTTWWRTLVPTRIIHFS